MKKVIALLLALTLAMGLVACGTTPANPTTEAPAETTEAPAEETTEAPAEETTEAPVEDTTGAPVEAPEANGANKVLTAIWNAVAEESKFFAVGGDFSAPVDGAPGNYSLEDEGLSTTLLLPAEQLANVDEAASLMHAMMANNFTCGVFHMAEGADAAALADAMKAAITGNQWICGMPEKLLIAVIDGEYVLACFGINDAVNPFEAAMGTAYADADVKYSEAIA